MNICCCVCLEIGNFICLEVNICFVLVYFVGVERQVVIFRNILLVFVFFYCEVYGLEFNFKQCFLVGLIVGKFKVFDFNIELLVERDYENFMQLRGVKKCLFYICIKVELSNNQLEKIVVVVKVEVLSIFVI